MREIMRFFGANRKRIKRIVHYRHHRYFDGVSFAETLDGGLNDIMEPILEAMSKSTKHYFTDILRDYDNIKRLLTESVEENSMFYAIGIRENGTDHIEFIETYIKSEDVDLSKRYSDIFWLYALIDADTHTGEPVRYIDVYQLHYNAE